MESVNLIKKYCNSDNNTEYLEKLKVYEKLFVKHCVTVLNGTVGNKKIAHDILTFFNYFDDGLPRKIQEITWEFSEDKINCNKIPKKSIVEFRKKISINKVNSQLLKSALQKYCRRNITRKAIWCGLEWGLFRCCVDETTTTNLKSIITNLRNRLRIIYVEDTCIANIDLLKIIDKSINVINYELNPEGINMDKEVVNIVSNISQSYHTRICSFVNSMYKIYNNESLYEKQKKFISYFPTVKKCYSHIENNLHITTEDNLYNTLLDKNIVSFYYARKLSISSDGKDIFGRKDKVFPIIRKVYNELNKTMVDKLDLSYIDITQKWYNEIKNSEAFLMFFLPMLVICFPYKKNGRLPNYQDYTKEWKNLVMSNIKNPAINFEQYVSDMHTKEGNRLGLSKDNLKGIEHFVKEGSYVNDEYIPNEECMELKNYYSFTKLLTFNKIDDNFLYLKNINDKDEDEDEEIIIKKPLNIINEEKDIFKYIARAQITTSSSKQDSYFAKMLKNYEDFKNGETVFVKGPYEDNIYDLLKFFIEAKKILNIPYINIDKIDIKMSPSIFEDEIDTNKNVEYYIRNKLKYNKKYTFLIYKNMCENNIFTTKYGKIKTQKSQGWIKSNTTIVDWDETNKKTNCKQFDTNDLKNLNYMVYYIIAIYFRYLFGIVDHANRNFLISDNILYSVDEENINMTKDSNFTKLEKNFDIINKNWSKVAEKIDSILKTWKTEIEKIPLTGNDRGKMMSRFNKIIEKPKFIFE